MAWDYELARTLKALGRESSLKQPFYMAKVVSLQPLTFSLLDGELMCPPYPMRLTALAASREWELEQEALALLGSILVIVDRIGGISRE